MKNNYKAICAVVALLLLVVPVASAAPGAPNIPNLFIGVAYVGDNVTRSGLVVKAMIDGVVKDTDIVGEGGKYALAVSGNENGDSILFYIESQKATEEATYSVMGAGVFDLDLHVDALPVTPFCGDKVCNNGETCSTCAVDCGACPSTPTTPPSTPASGGSSGSSGSGGGGHDSINSELIPINKDDTADKTPVEVTTTNHKDSSTEGAGITGAFTGLVTPTNVVIVGSLVALLGGGAAYLFLFRKVKPL